MIKTYFKDVVCFAFIAVLAFLIAGRPGIDLAPKATIADQPKRKAPIAESENQRKDTPVASSYAALKERNIFAESGSYAVAAAEKQQTLPENPYQLIAVLKGKQRKAVFREYTGAVVTAAVGKKMIDGFELKTIDNISVKLQREQEKKNLILFNAVGGSKPASIVREKVQPPDAYTLTGILGDRQKKAVFRNASGAISIMPAGATMPDGSVVAAVTALSVKLKKGGKVTELKLFDATGTAGK